MKKTGIEILLWLCLVLFVQTAFAGDRVGNPVREDSTWWFKPALSVGYAFDAGDTHYKFTAQGLGVGGVQKVDSTSEFSGIYLRGELPFALTDRLKLAVSGSWAFSGSNNLLDEYNDNTNRREWDSDSYWVAVDLLASYAFVKNISFIKDIAVAVGCRWDYYDASFDSPHSATFPTSLPTDDGNSRIQTLAPVFGLTATLKGFKSGIFGGDVKLGGLGGPILWGDVKHSEMFGGVLTTLDFDGNLHKGYFYELSGEITALSGKIAPRVEASLSIFAKFSQCSAKGELSGSTSGVIFSRDDFDFKLDRKPVVVGIKASMAF
jgi:hypothetical protein